MPDLIVPLVTLPPVAPHMEKMRAAGVSIRRPNPWEQSKLSAFVLSEFTQGWADEVSVAFSRQPVTAFVAIRDKEIIGFAAYECTRKCYFGPTGVAKSARGLGVGTALLLGCLYGLRDLGYTYGIIGDAGPVDFYAKTVGAVPLPFTKEQGIYTLTNEPMMTSLK